MYTDKDLVVSPEKLECSATLSSNSHMATIRGKQETVSWVVYSSQFTTVLSIPWSYICVHSCTCSSCFSFPHCDKPLKICLSLSLSLSLSLYIYIYIYTYTVTLLCLTLCDSVDCSPPGSSVHGILQARILKGATMPSSRGSSNPEIEAMIPVAPALQADSLPPRDREAWWAAVYGAAQSRTWLKWLSSSRATGEVYIEWESE